MQLLNDSNDSMGHLLLNMLLITCVYFFTKQLFFGSEPV